MNASGYATDALYPDTYFRELSPVWLNYVAALGGGQPRPLDRPFTYLELGCGLGSSAVTHASQYRHGEFHACDFNSRHIEAGRGRAAQARLTNIEFHPESFAALAQRQLPQFDFIVLHGVYSWVDASVRTTIRQAIQQRSKPGALVYVSYNCLPGWAVEAPLRTLLLELTRAQTGKSAVEQLKALSLSKLRYFESYPQTGAAIESFLRSPEGYLEHEFLEVAWEPRYSIDVADEMTQIGLSYLGSATLADNHPALVMDERAAQAVAELATQRQRILAADFAVNRRFRRDVFVSGARTETGAGVLNAVLIGCPAGPESLGTEVRIPRGVLKFQQDFIDALAGLVSRGPISLGEAVTVLSKTENQRVEVGRNLLYLIASGALSPVG